MNKDVYVSSPLLPELDDFIPYLRAIWESKRLTNTGPFHQAFEQALADYLDVEHLSLFNNGTTALMVALQALAIDEKSLPPLTPLRPRLMHWSGIG